MKTQLLILFLAASAIAGGDGIQSIPIVGCYCDDNPGNFRSGPLMALGEQYRFSNLSADGVSVTIMPGSVQSLGTVMPGQTVAFVSGGTSLMIFARGHDGETVKGLRLEVVQPVARIEPVKPSLR